METNESENPQDDPEILDEMSSLRNCIGLKHYYQLNDKLRVWDKREYSEINRAWQSGAIELIERLAGCESLLVFLLGLGSKKPIDPLKRTYEVNRDIIEKHLVSKN